MNDIVKQIIQDICYIGATTIIGIASYYFKRFIDSKQDLVKHQKDMSVDYLKYVNKKI